MEGELKEVDTCGRFRDMFTHPRGRSTHGGETVTVTKRFATGTFSFVSEIETEGKVVVGVVNLLCSYEMKKGTYSNAVNEK